MSKPNAGEKKPIKKNKPKSGAVTLIVKELGVAHVVRVANNERVQTLKRVDKDAYSALTATYENEEVANVACAELTELLGFKVIIKK